ncbi:MAG: M48 family metallopeptidase [Candidatus Micrarchaeaceae archaeon]|jgi:predicted metal-dependent hydrolase
MDFPEVAVSDRKLDVKIISTHNKNAYARVSNGSIVISIPSRLGKAQSYKLASDLYSKIRKSILKKPEIYLYQGKKEIISFHDNQLLNLLGKPFTVHILESDRKSARAHVNNSDIIIKIPSFWSIEQKDESIAKLGRKLISKAMLNEVNDRISFFNGQFFHSEIDNIKITNAHTKWGSCSTSRRFDGAKLTLNYKLLFMPSDCIDYVIVHELAHTKHHNHSKSFWKLVSEIIPDYRQKKKLLKESAYKLKFDNNQMN